MYTNNIFSCCTYRRQFPPYFYRRCFNLKDCPPIWQGYELVGGYNVNDCNICPDYPGPLPPHDMYYPKYNSPQYVYPNYYHCSYPPPYYPAKKCCEYIHREYGTSRNECVDFGTSCPNLRDYDLVGEPNVPNCDVCQ
ncbi:hypothetical protein IAW_05976 [Bacillus cereus str. Schrouff]|nr:hypothetical protein IAW_05976 [Bacillus cereus str. Schrouff]EOO80796.1 hypothetical protein IGY_06162 [Bacillus cereus K-5975c]